LLTAYTWLGTKFNDIFDVTCPAFVLFDVKQIRLKFLSFPATYMTSKLKIPNNIELAAKLKITFDIHTNESQSRQNYSKCSKRGSTFLESLTSLLIHREELQFPFTSSGLYKK